MDIIISDNWLRDFLITKATPYEISKYVSLCGPSIEKIKKVEGDTLYYVEVTTNRVDCVGVYGFAREVAAILPRFGIPARLKEFNPKISKKTVGNLPFIIEPDHKLVKRTIGVVLTNIKNQKTPKWMQKRLIESGVRSLNAIVDITNYVMLETGHPSHAFDYDLIKHKKFVIRESKKGEALTTFDGKRYELQGGDIVFDDGDGEIIDLPGIMGTKNSVVGSDTKRVFFFIDNNEPSKIRNTSMRYGIRTVAATINEKGVDAELGMKALLRGIELYQTICGANISSKIYDDYPNPYKSKKITTDISFISKSLGVDISKKDISKYLTSLGFDPKWNNDVISVTIPSFRSEDINIPEDLIEEIARLYGYHNLPSTLMRGEIPYQISNSLYEFEWKIKNILKALGAIEVYTLSLVPKNFNNDSPSLKLKNPLGIESKFLRNNLSNSLSEIVRQNSGNYEKLFFYEIANVYLPKNDNLPEEKRIIGTVFDGYRFSEIKGLLETLFLNELHIKIEFIKRKTNQNIDIVSNNTMLGTLLETDDDITTIEFELKILHKLYKEFPAFKPIPKYPPQIEDLTIKVPVGLEIGKIIKSIKESSEFISDIELHDIYNNRFTFRIGYQNPKDNLTDKEIDVIRKKIFDKLAADYNIQNEV